MEAVSGGFKENKAGPDWSCWSAIPVTVGSSFVRSSPFAILLLGAAARIALVTALCGPGYQCPLNPGSSAQGAIAKKVAGGVT